MLEPHRFNGKSFHNGFQKGGKHRLPHPAQCQTRQGNTELAGTQGSIQMIQHLLGHDCLAVSLANQGFDL